MQTFTKRFTHSNMKTAVAIVNRYVGTLNNRKFGRNRRGTVMLTGARFSVDEGQVHVLMDFAVKAGIPGLRGVHIYEFTDFDKLMRKVKS